MSEPGLDAISLEQALIDFEVANARVIDLAQRLAKMSKEVIALRGQLQLAQTKIAVLEHASNMITPTSNVITPNLEEEEAQRRLAEIRNSRALMIAALFAPRLR